MSDPHIISIAIEAKATADGARLAAALDKLSASDTSVAVSTDAKSGQIVLQGASEDDLDAFVSGLMATFGIDLAVSTPRVVYRETLRKRIEKDYTFRAPLDGLDQFARVRMIFEPRVAGGGFRSELVAGALPTPFLKAVETGVATVMQAGILEGYPLVDVSATLVDAGHRERDSSALAFEVAARSAFREALEDGGSDLLEPIMAVKVVTPTEYLGVVTGDIRARRGSLRQQGREGEATVVEGFLPLSNTFGYAHQLRACTQGRANHTARFSHYAPVPSPHDDGPAAPAIALRRA